MLELAHDARTAKFVRTEQIRADLLDGRSAGGADRGFFDGNTALGMLHGAEYFGNDFV